MADNKKKRKVSSQALEKVVEADVPPVVEATPGWPRAYWERTVSIFEERSRKKQKADQAAKKALLNLVKEVEADAKEVIESRFHTLSDRVEHHPLLQSLEKRSERATRTVDAWLDRLGLVRKSTLA